MFEPDLTAFAEVCYVLPDGGMWRAVVYRTGDGWELKFGRTQRTDGFIHAGTFKNGKALIKFIREKAAERTGSKDWEPIYDTLHNLRNRNVMSVVPDCYVISESSESDSLGRGLPECAGCPYRTSCEEPSAQPVIIPVTQVEETEDVFRHRLAEKLRARYGATDEQKSLCDAAKTSTTCGTQND